MVGARAWLRARQQHVRLSTFQGRVRRFVTGNTACLGGTLYRYGDCIEAWNDALGAGDKDRMELALTRYASRINYFFHYGSVLQE